MMGRKSTVHSDDEAGDKNVRTVRAQAKVSFGLCTIMIAESYAQIQ